MKILLAFILIIPSLVFGQKDTLIDKQIPIILQKRLTDAQNLADSFNKLADSLQENVDSLKSNSGNVKTNKSNYDSDVIKYLQDLPVTLSISLLIFGLILILAILLFLYKTGKGFGNYAFQILGLVIVITAALFLIVTGYDKDQITPVIGLLGTIVGFIFGSNINKNQTQNNESDKEKDGQNEKETKLNNGKIEESVKT